ncbi:MAG TPA: transglycosylase SLT domain-containing protein, partial [Nitrospira sp.]|nr:transglycosylase SLT domain-containing protein [Nitrospira sp.]
PTVIRRSLCSLLLLVGSVGGSAALSTEPDSCDQPEPCFQAAALPKERLGKVWSKEQLLTLKLERLQRLIERFPDTLWAKRAGLLSGVLSIETNPSAAMPFLRAAQRDFPVLDDYIRFWLAQAHLALGEAKEAAVLLESIPLAVPDSNILTRAAYKTGEAWYQASACQEATTWFTKAVAMNDKDPGTPQAYLRRAACRLRDNDIRPARELLQQLWVRFPYTPEAKEAEALLSSNLGGEAWIAQPADRLARAQAFLGQAFHAEAIEELKKFLAADPHSPRRADAKLKLGIAYVRLKQYDQARDTFRALAKEGGPESQEAAVWLARVYLRQGQGDKLLEAARVLPATSLSAEQKGQITLFVGMWLEDQKQFDEAMAKYHQVAKQGEPASQRAEGLWRVGWVNYRTGRYREAGEHWRALAEQHDSEFEPQALYWMGRAAEQNQQPEAQDYYIKLCQRHRFTYYCQLARDRAKMTPIPALEVTSASAEALKNGEPPAPGSTRADIAMHTAYRRAIELKTLGLDADAAQEVAVLTDRYTREPDALVALSTMLNEVGAYHQALRLARARFRDQLERTGGTVAPSLWNVAYPTGLLPTIKLQAAKGVDPYLIAAIIREESQYDVKAVSRVGAIGLMQVMPATANNVAQRVGLPAVRREDLFDQETNIRIGVRYVEQLLEQFSGNVVHTIASYNAGPLAVGNWIAQYRTQGQDEFVELIPYQETRQYVKRVLRSYREYVRLGSTS